MRKYTMVDKATGEETEADLDTVERVTGVEIVYIDWVLEQDGKFENGDWGIRLRPLAELARNNFSAHSSDKLC